MTPKKKEHVARHMLLLLRSSFVLPQLLTLNQFNANAQLICLNGQQSQAIDTFLNASSTDDGQVGTPYRVYLWHYLYVIQLAVFKFFISYWF
mgnify:CR=1 FL=1